MISSGLVNVFSNDVLRSLAFYQDVLGFEETFRTPTDGVPDHVEMVTGGFTIAISSAEAARRVHGMEPTVGHTAMNLVFWVEDVDTVFDRVKHAGAPVVTEPHDSGNNNRNAVLRDPDGTLIELVAKRS